MYGVVVGNECDAVNCCFQREKDWRETSKTDDRNERRVVVRGNERGGNNLHLIQKVLSSSGSILRARLQAAVAHTPPAPHSYFASLLLRIGHLSPVNAAEATSIHPQQ